MAEQKQKTKLSRSGDISDSKEDKNKLQPDAANVDMPDVNDIPGQKHVHTPRLGELADTTASSDDEEGKGIYDDGIDTDDASNVSDEEKELLQQTSESMSSRDDLAARKIKFDDRDFEGEALNEAQDLSGNDLDVPGEKLDDANKDIGEEDEENNEYSLGGDNHDS